MTTVDDFEALIAFLRAWLDEEAASAQDATAGPWKWGIPDPRYWVRTEEGPASEDLLQGPSGVWVLMTSKAGGVSVHDARHIARWDPSRVLAEVEAKRSRIAELVDALEYGDGHGAPGYAVLQATVVRLIKLEAQPLSSRPGFKPEWRLT